MVGSAGSAPALLATLGSTEVDVLLLDVSMPGGAFFEVLRQCLEIQPDLAVLVVSGMPVEVFGQRALQLGARGYAEKSLPPEELADAIRRVGDGHLFTGPGLSRARAEQRPDGHLANYR